MKHKAYIAIALMLFYGFSVTAQTDTIIYIKSEDGELVLSNKPSQKPLDSLSDQDIELLNLELAQKMSRIEDRLYTIKTTEGKLTKQQKKELVSGLSDLDSELDEVDDKIDDYSEHVSDVVKERYYSCYDRYRELEKTYAPIIERAKLPNVTNRYGMLDLGFSTYYDVVNPPRVESFDPTSPELGNSIGVTIHLFQQRINLVNHNLNLMYGIGLQLNNYAFDNPTVLIADQPEVTWERRQGSFKKNRLKANYLHIPLMFNYETRPGSRRKSFRFNAGAYMNILYSSNVKTKIDGDKTKTKDRFNLNRFTPGLYGQIGYGYVNVYGTWSLANLFDKDEDAGYELVPIGFGIKLLPF